MASSQVFSYIGWGFLPSLVTNWTQSFYYRLITRAGDPRPTPGTPRWVRDHRRIYISIVGFYLLYTIFEAYAGIRAAGNLYSLLGVSPLVDDKTLRIQWRKLRLMYHPDKVGGDRNEAQAAFVVLQNAYDVVSEPTKRFAYDRFGPWAMEWGKAGVGMRDYVFTGLMRMVPYYGGTGLILLVLSVLGKLEYGRYWRFYSFFALLIFEVFVSTRPYILFTHIPAPFDLLINPPLLPFEQLILARKIVFAVFIALSQIGPMLSPPTVQAQTSSQPSTAAELAAQLRPQLQQLEAIARIVDSQAQQAMAAEFMPFQGDEKAAAELEGRLEEFLVEQQLRGDDAVRKAMAEAVRERRRA